MAINKKHPVCVKQIEMDGGPAAATRFRFMYNGCASWLASPFAHFPAYSRGHEKLKSPDGKRVRAI